MFDGLLSPEKESLGVGSVGAERRESRESVVVRGKAGVEGFAGRGDERKRGHSLFSPVGGLWRRFKGVVSCVGERESRGCSGRVGGCPELRVELDAQGVYLAVGQCWRSLGRAVEGLGS